MSLLPEEESSNTPASLWQHYKVPLLLGSGSIILAVLSLVLLVKATQTATPIQFSHTDSITLGTQSANLSLPAGKAGLIIVDVEGAVVRPGLVELPSGARVEEALIAAGGLTAGADAAYISKNINRAMKVADGMKLYIPKLGDGVSQDTTSHNSSSLLRSPDGTTQNAGGVSVNFASKDQLESLSGVGPVTAQKIIDNRPYARLEDLVTKKAIGPSLFEKLKNQLSL